MQQQVIVARRWQTLATLPLAAAAIALGVWALLQPSSSYIVVCAWIAIFFGAASLPVMLVQILRPGRLTLSPEALVIDNGLAKPKVVPWSDIEGFYVWKHDNAKTPAFRYIEGHQPSTAAEMALRKRAGVDDTLAARWPIAAEALVNMLNQYRLHFTR